ncbi:hypothetical protein JXR01_01185 [Candidatus Kaiserbacteria bacterium]|nr:MAG: hypothetical protein JXR01_01185 [Candidatus Kaiserbacteria bacterium]
MKFDLADLFSFLAGLILGILLGIELVVDFLNKWQTIVGALIGAAAPLIVYFIGKRQDEYYAYLVRLDKSLSLAVVNLSEIDNTLHTFVRGSLQKLIDSVTQTAKQDEFVARAFVPLLFTYELPEEIIKLSTKTAYIDNNLLLVYSRSKELDPMVADIGRQYDKTYELQLTLVGSKMTPGSQITTDLNSMYAQNLESFKAYIEEYWAKNNMPIYLKELVQLQVAVRELREMRRLGWIVWRWKYEKGAADDFAVMQESIDKSLEKKVGERLDLIKRTAFNRYKKND